MYVILDYRIFLILTGLLVFGMRCSSNKSKL